MDVLSVPGRVVSAHSRDQIGVGGQGFQHAGDRIVAIVADFLGRQRLAVFVFDGHVAVIDFGEQQVEQFGGRARAVHERQQRTRGRIDGEAAVAAASRARIAARLQSCGRAGTGRSLIWWTNCGGCSVTSIIPRSWHAITVSGRVIVASPGAICSAAATRCARASKGMNAGRASCKQLSTAFMSGMEGVIVTLSRLVNFTGTSGARSTSPSGVAAASDDSGQRPPAQSPR